MSARLPWWLSKTCVFCDRIRDDEYEPTFVANVIQFEPLNPVTPGHMLFLPREHVMDASVDAWLTGSTFAAAAEWGKRKNAQFNLITSAGMDATQTITHLHVHYVPRRRLDGLHLPWTGQTKE